MSMPPSSQNPPHPGEGAPPIPPTTNPPATGAPGATTAAAVGGAQAVGAEEPDTLLEQYAKSETAIYRSIQQAARQGVADARTRLESATRAKADAAAGLAKLKAEEAALRQQQSAAETRAAMDALSEQRTDNKIALRHQDGAIAEAEEAFQLASKDMERATAAAAEADELLATATAYEKDTEAISKERNKWRADLAGRLATLQVDATAALASDLYLLARERVDGSPAQGGKPVTSAPSPSDTAPAETASEWGGESSYEEEGSAGTGDGDRGTNEDAPETPPDDGDPGETETEDAAPVGPEIPLPLRTRARQRRKAEAERRCMLRERYRWFETKLEDEQGKYGFAGKVDVARWRLAAAEANLRWHVGTARERYERALELLAPIAAAPPLAEPISTVDPGIGAAVQDETAFDEARKAGLQAAIKKDVEDADAQIQDHAAVVPPEPNPASTTPAGGTAENETAGTNTMTGETTTSATPATTTRDTVIAAKRALDEARAELAAKTAAFVAANPGKDAAVDLAVKAAAVAVKAREQDLARERAAYLTMARPLDEWEVAVPDEAWRRLADFDEATTILWGLAEKPTQPVCPGAPAAESPAQMVQNVDTAERALVVALAAQATAFRTRRTYRSQAQTYRDRWLAAAQSAPARSFSALRGDS